MDETDKIAYTEVLSILRNINPQYSSKIPINFIKFLIANSIEDVNNEYSGFDRNGNIHVSNTAEAILNYINLEYWSTEEEKQELLKLYLKNEEEIKNKYNPDNIFKKVNKNKKTNIETSEDTINTSLIEYKKSFFTIFKEFILKVFNINNQVDD